MLLLPVAGVADAANAAAVFCAADINTTSGVAAATTTTVVIRFRTLLLLSSAPEQTASVYVRVAASVSSSLCSRYTVRHARKNRDPTLQYLILLLALTQLYET